MRIIVSGGGSAGHISPILATVDALKQLDKNVEILYVGQAGGMEAKIAAASGLEFASIKAGKFRRYQGVGASRLGNVFNVDTLGLNARDSARVVAGIIGSLTIIRRFKPDVVFAKGGFVGLPVGIAARILRVPYVIHESDVSPGLANRILSRWATRIAVGFPVKSYKTLDAARLVFTGNPVRPEIARAHRLEGMAAFKLTDDAPVILVTGGSQGAVQINNLILDALPQLLQRYQVIHQTGEGEFERITFELGRMSQELVHRERYHPFAFLLKELPLALAAADLVVGRAGAGTIAESAILGKPTVLIPNYQMAGHQVENGRILSRAGAARVLDGSRLTADQFVREVDRVLGSTQEQEHLSKAIRQFAQPDAPKRLAELILSVGRGEA